VAEQRRRCDLRLRLAPDAPAAPVAGCCAVCPRGV